MPGGSKSEKKRKKQEGIPPPRCTMSCMPYVLFDPLDPPIVTVGKDNCFRTCRPCMLVRPFDRPHFSNLTKQNKQNNFRYWRDYWPSGLLSRFSLLLLFLKNIDPQGRPQSQPVVITISTQVVRPTVWNWPNSPIPGSLMAVVLFFVPYWSTRPRPIGGHYFHTWCPYVRTSVRPYVCPSEKKNTLCCAEAKYATTLKQSKMT